MKRFISLLLLGISIFVYCEPVPITGRRQLHLIPESQMVALGLQSYNTVKDSVPSVKGTILSQQVTRVGNRIACAVDTFLKQNNQEKRIKNFKWQFTLFKDSSVNAWAMPGGGVGVYTGIVPYTQNDTGLAVVMGHEIAHVVAQHGDERMSQMLLVEFGGAALSVALANKPALTQQLALAAFGMGSQVGVILPYSRIEESEADRLGLIFMAMAGYNPNAAVPFWKRMMCASKGAPPEFLSTHPSDANRIKAIEKEIPEAMKYYKPR